MRATRSLPDGYSLHQSIDLSKDRRLLIILNLAGLLLLIICIGLFDRIAIALRPDLRIAQQHHGLFSSSLTNLILIMVSIVLVVIIHEVIHGLFFWLITGDFPTFGISATYAFAAAPDWFIRSAYYLIVGLSPLVMITLVGVLLIALAPVTLLSPLLFALAVNASGAIGDIVIVSWVLTKPANALICDRGHAVDVYLPGAQREN